MRQLDIDRACIDYEVNYLDRDKFEESKAYREQWQYMECHKDTYPAAQAILERAGVARWAHS